MPRCVKFVGLNPPPPLNDSYIITDIDGKMFMVLRKGETAIISDEVFESLKKQGVIGENGPLIEC